MRSRLQTRFILAGCWLVAATVGSSLWSAITFVQLNRVVDETIRTSQEIIDLSAELHSSLEREDDALLLYLSGNVEQARQELEAERQRGDMGFEKLINRIGDGKQQEVVVSLRQQIDRYRAAGDTLLNLNPELKGLEQYHLQVNPLLRQAVSGCDQLREANFRSMQQAGVQARDEAARGKRLVIAIAIFSILLGIGVSVWLARSILLPIRDLMVSLEAVRKGDFERRVRYITGDELGELGSAFNRMTEALAEYRRSSLGELLASKTTLEATLNALPDAVLVFQPDGTLAGTNPLARQILQVKGANAANHLSQIPFLSEHRQMIAQALVGQVSTTNQLDLEQTLNVVLNQHPRRFLLKTIPIPEWTPQRYGAVVILDDVTEFVRLDELRSELIAVASHELKSPLTAMQMNLLMLREATADWPERFQQLLDTAVSGCEELLQTIDELLDLTLIEAGQLRLHTTPVELGALIAVARKPLQTRFEDANVQLILKTPPVPVIIMGDPKRLQSVLANILSNALKYSPPGGSVWVEVSSPQNTQSPDQSTVQITVTDQGPGIPTEFQERVFEKFFRVEHHLGTRGKTVRGTGIGLYLCRQIIQSHGGSITCQASPYGFGTQIAITFPVKV